MIRPYSIPSLPVVGFCEKSASSPGRDTRKYAYAQMQSYIENLPQGLEWSADYIQSIPRKLVWDWFQTWPAGPNSPHRVIGDIVCLLRSPHTHKKHFSPRLFVNNPRPRVFVSGIFTTDPTKSGDLMFMKSRKSSLNSVRIRIGSRTLTTHQLVLTRTDARVDSALSCAVFSFKPRRVFERSRFVVIHSFDEHLGFLYWDSCDVLAAPAFKPGGWGMSAIFGYAINNLHRNAKARYASVEEMRRIVSTGFFSGYAPFVNRWPLEILQNAYDVGYPEYSDVHGSNINLNSQSPIITGGSGFLKRKPFLAGNSEFGVIQPSDGCP